MNYLKYNNLIKYVRKRNTGGRENPYTERGTFLEKTNLKEIHLIHAVFLL